MLDTGNPFGVFLNNNYVKLDTNNFFSSGTAGSGQKLDLYKSSVEVISLTNQVKFEKLSNVVHADFGFIEKGITPNFLGFIGYEFLKNYEFVIDYKLQEIHLYLLDDKGDSSLPNFSDVNIYALLDFTTTTDEQIPNVEIYGSGQKINLQFDSGTLGSLTLTKKSAKRLMNDGRLIEGEKKSSEKEPASRYYTLRDFTYGNTSIGDITNLTFSEGKSNELMCGYHFLKNYLSVWNYRKRTLTLVKN